MTKLLDCTLRDGGYVNNFAFSDKTVKDIIFNLCASGIDYIEAGFLRNSKSESENTVYLSIHDVEKFLPSDLNHSEIFLMIVYGKYDLEKLPPKSQTKIDGIRVTFKKNEIDSALEFCKQIIAKGYKVCANPTGVSGYSDYELITLVEKINRLNPFAFSIVDTLGLLMPRDLLRIFNIIDNNLKENIVIGFHSHNNLLQSFTDASALLCSEGNRKTIIDTSIMGMGRGAGNLNTELMFSYLNDNYRSHYNILPILKIIDEHISKIFAKTPWGYSMPYFLAANSKCHPNYASYLVDMQSLSVEAINAILQRLPTDSRITYNENLIKKLYLQYQQNYIDDGEALSTLKQEIANRPILVIGSGKSIISHQNEIKKFILQNNPFIISLNFAPEEYKVDKAFISNVKRFDEQKIQVPMMITSNIKTENSNLLVFNYGSYLNNSEMYDNSALMLCNILQHISISDIWFAGLDGFTKDNDNYYKPDMINNAKLGFTDNRNSIMHSMLKEYSYFMNFHFLTPSLYEETNVA